MPTNILRRRSAPQTSNARDGVGEALRRRVLIKIGRVDFVAELLDTPTASRIWSALPIFSTAETWGASVNFATPIESGRERGARTHVKRSEIYYWSERDRIILAYGPTPISKPGEVRLPSPCNVWASTNFDMSLLKRTTPGEKVSVVAL